jgi:hypothetical protein
MERKERAAQQARAERLRPLAPLVRGALKKAAREGRITAWPDLKRRTGESQLDQLTHQEKVEVLVLVENNVEAAAPLWSVLLAAQGDLVALQLHRDVAHRLGRTLPDADIELVSQLAAERAKLDRQTP